MISYSVLEDWTKPHKIDHNGYGHHYQNHLSATNQRPSSSSYYLSAWKKTHSHRESENEHGVTFISTISAEGLVFWYFAKTILKKKPGRLLVLTFIDPQKFPLKYDSKREHGIQDDGSLGRRRKRAKSDR